MSYNYEIVGADADLIDQFGNLNLYDADEVVDITTGRVIARPSQERRRFVVAPHPTPFKVVVPNKTVESTIGYVTSINSSGNTCIHAKCGCSGAKTAFTTKHAQKYRFPRWCKKCTYFGIN